MTPFQSDLWALWQQVGQDELTFLPALLLNYCPMVPRFIVLHGAPCFAAEPIQPASRYANFAVLEGV